MKKHGTYEEKANRRFPVGYTIVLLVLIALQIGLIFFGIRYQPQPQDLIHEYHVTVQPRTDGSVDITYELLWQALDASEPLTWVDIGMANKNFSIYGDSLSANIQACEKYTDADYVSVRVAFRKSYVGGETVRFFFTVNQKDLLCRDDQGYFYEFVPGWFNEIQVKKYTFTWRMENGNDIVRQGELDYGEYDTLFVRYDTDAFAGCDTVKYRPFNGGDAHDGMRENKNGVMFLCIFLAAVLIIGEIIIIDCYVSYGRGRGFLREYGTHVHVHGRTNPVYVRARARHHASSGSGGRSGGCACACACACAGGGRAGCSQKETYGTTSEKNN